MMAITKEIGANVILESKGQVTLQLRDDLRLWGIFGGLSEEGEDPKETTVVLDPERLVLLKVFENACYQSHLFHYPMEGELDSAVLTEGIKFEARSRDDLCPEEIVPWHWDMLEWFWEHGPRSYELL